MPELFIQNIFLRLEQTEYLINILETVADEDTKENEDEAEAEEKVEENKPETEPDPEPKVEEGMLLLFPITLGDFKNISIIFLLAVARCY